MRDQFNSLIGNVARMRPNTTMETSCSTHKHYHDSNEVQARAEYDMKIESNFEQMRMSTQVNLQQKKAKRDDVELLLPSSFLSHCKIVASTYDDKSSGASPGNPPPQGNIKRSQTSAAAQKNTSGGEKSLAQDQQYDDTCSVLSQNNSTQNLNSLRQ